jgi:hypothetical protein
VFRRTFLKTIGAVVTAAAVPLRAVLPEHRLPRWARLSEVVTITHCATNYDDGSVSVTGMTRDGVSISFRTSVDAFEIGREIRVSHYRW